MAEVEKSEVPGEGCMESEYLLVLSEVVFSFMGVLSVFYVSHPIAVRTVSVKQSYFIYVWYSSRCYYSGNTNKTLNGYRLM